MIRTERRSMVRIGEKTGDKDGEKSTDGRREDE